MFKRDAIVWLLLLHLLNSTATQSIFYKIIISIYLVKIVIKIIIMIFSMINIEVIGRGDTQECFILGGGSDV